MPDPAEFQRAFGALLAGRGAPPPDAALARALTIHRNTAAKAAQDALAANFPVVGALVGEEAMRGVAAAFVDVAPPSTPRLCVYGDGFADFLAGWPPFVEAGYLAEVARLEWQVVEALFAADADPLGADAFADGVDPGLQLAPHPATRLVASPAPIVDLWRAHQADTPADALDALHWRPQTALVTRPAGRVQVQEASPGAAAFLAALGHDGASVAEAAQAAAQAGDLAEAFSTLLLAGALVPAA